MKLTPEQLEYLNDFIRQHGIRYYDVRLELTDHLASGIEQEMAENPAVSFEGALKKTYLGFGKQGFEDFVAMKEKEARNEVWKTFVVYVTKPLRLLTAIVGGALFYKVSTIIPDDDFKPFIIGSFLLASFPLFIQMARFAYVTSAQLTISRYKFYSRLTGSFGIVFYGLFNAYTETLRTGITLSTALIIYCTLTVVEVAGIIREKYRLKYPEIYS